MTTKELLGVALFGGFCMFSEMAKSCDCAWESWEALKKANIKIRTMPSVVIGDRASYRNSVVSLTNTWDCRVFLHELVHHSQEQRYGPARSEEEWIQRERDAAIITDMAMDGRGC